MCLSVRQRFPKLDIRNVVEASEEVTIGGWCGFGHTSCHHEFTVRPFRCLGMSAASATATATISVNICRREELWLMIAGIGLSKLFFLSN